MPEIDHVGFAVRSLDAKKELMEKLLGLRFLERRVYERGGNTARLDFYAAGGGVMELVEFSDPNAPINQFIEVRGEGLHHVCFRVEDIRAAMADWEAKGVKFALKPPLYGSRGGLITFADPSTTGGLLIELIQYLEEGEEVPDWAQK